MYRPTLLLPVYLCLLAGPAYCAEPILKAQVHMAGSIVDAACAIQVGNENQTVFLQPTAINGLVSGEVPIQQPLNIYITRCIGSSAEIARSPHAFKITFEGDGQTQFNVQGAAKGIAIQIKDGQGKLISPGMPVEDRTLSADNMALNYSIALVGTGQSLEAGDFHATIKLNIQHF